MNDILQLEKEAENATLNGDFKKAFKLYEKCRYEYPKIGKYWFGCGYAKLRLNKLADANEYFIIAYFMDKNNFSSAYNVGYTFLYLGEFSASLRYFDYAITLDKGNYLPYYFKGIALSRLNRINEAIESIIKSISLKSDYAPAYFELGVLYFKIQNLTQSLYNFDQASKKGYPLQEVNEWIDRIKEEFEKYKSGFSGISGYGKEFP